MSAKEKRAVYVYLVLAIIVILAIGLFRDSIFGESEKGTIIISNLEEDTSIFIDEREAKRTRKPEESVKIRSIDPGLHIVLVAKVGFWPWVKEVHLEPKETVTLSPYFIFQNTNGFFIGEEDPEYNEITNKINGVNAPSFENRRISSDGNVSIWIDGSSLFNEWLGSEEERPNYYCSEFGCHNVIVSLGVGGEIRNAEFYKDRNDVFIVSFGNGVFAIEADTQNNQNFHPILEGESPQFVLNDENTIYARNGNTLMEVAI